MKQQKELFIVDSTGEIIDTIDASDKYVKLSEGDKVVRKGVLQYLQETTDIKYHFIKINPVVHKRIANKYPIINNLIEYTNYMDNELRFKNGKVINIKKMVEICNVSESTIKRQLKNLMSEDIIHKCKRGKETVYVLNPFYVMCGKKIYLSLYEQFKMSSLRLECEGWKE